MAHQLSTPASVGTSVATHAWRTVLDWCRSVIGEGTRVYHPEAYYMRGPGPRWREKHAQSRDIETFSG
jgi:hypothetical protein